MEAFSPPGWITVAFTALTLAVLCFDAFLVGKAAAATGRDSKRWGLRALAALGVWASLHAAVAESGVLVGDGFPPPAMPYLAAVLGSAVVVAFSPIGRALAALPPLMLVGLQVFRLPLEVLLHELYRAGQLPVQMTWSGYNFDVVTALSAVVVVGLVRRGGSERLVWAWNVLGFVLLVTVVSIAVTSAPLPIRQFHEGPAVVLPFHAPYNWIVNVHVWTALVSHLVLFRAWRQRAAA